MKSAQAPSSNVLMKALFSVGVWYAPWPKLKPVLTPARNVCGYYIPCILVVGD
jgi:hypothetical protein